MLDNMADSNYEEYKQFVSRHISDGFEKIKEEKTQKINEEKILPQPGVLMKFRANLKEFQIKEKDEKLDFLADKFKIDHKNQEPKKPLNFEKNVKIYLNICYSDQ